MHLFKDKTRAMVLLKEAAVRGKSREAMRITRTNTIAERVPRWGTVCTELEQMLKQESPTN